MNHKIAKITRKKNGNYNIYLTDFEKPYFELDKNVYYQYPFAQGDEIESELINKIISENEKTLCLQKGLNFLSYAPKTKKELQLKLKIAGFSKAASEYAVNKLSEMNLLNDDDYAAQAAESYIKGRKMSKRNIVSKLMQKGIDKEKIEEITKNCTDETEYENALYYAQKKLNSLSSKSLDKYELKRKIYSALNYRGFSYDAIKKAANEVLDGCSEE